MGLSMIEARELSKRYGSTIAVDRLTFNLKPGLVTGFLGPNGAGKSTTMRLILGLDAPTAGTVYVGGASYRDHRFPLHAVGALLDATAIHPARSAYDHLLARARSNRIGARRVDQVLELVGLEHVARRRVGPFSLGMKQRLGIAAAMLGDPPVLLFDEPVTGLDPDGILWIRNFFRHLADEGRTVFVSSHLMSEMARTAQRLIVIGRGKLIADTTIENLLANGTSSVLVRSPQTDVLAELIGRAGGEVRADDSALTVSGLDARTIGELASRNAITLHELTPQQASLEEAFFALTDDETEYRTASIAGRRSS
jgi:ABC-2 type transport system ATP-binding protein